MQVSQEIVSEKLQQLLSLAQLTDKLKRKPTCSCGHICKRPIDATLSPIQNGDMFKHPAIHRRSNLTFSADAMRSKFGRPRSRPLFPTKVIVQRFLPVQPGMNQSYGVVSNDGSLPKSLNTTASAGMTRRDDECHHITIQSADGEISQILTTKINQLTEKRGAGGGGEGSSNSFGSFMDLSLPTSGLTITQDEEFVYSNTPLMSPMRIIHESPVEDVGMEDVSLSSILGHLESVSSSKHTNEVSKVKRILMNNEGLF